MTEEPVHNAVATATATATAAATSPRDFATEVELSELAEFTHGMGLKVVDLEDLERAFDGEAEDDSESDNEAASYNGRGAAAVARARARAGTGTGTGAVDADAYTAADTAADTVADTVADTDSLLAMEDTRLTRSRTISESIASSIIGGMATSEAAAAAAAAGGPNALINNVTRRVETALRSITRPLATEKVFPLSLPFGHSLNKLVPKMRSFTMSGESADAAASAAASAAADMFSLSTMEEARLYKHGRGADNSRLRAVKKAIIPSLPQNFLTAAVSATPVPDYESVYEKLHGNVVVMGGYRGSVLRETATGRLLWIPLKVGLNLRKVDFVLGPNDSDEDNADKKIYADGMLTNVGPIDISRKLMKRLAASGHTRVHEFGYDWRLSCAKSSAKLVQFLENLLAADANHEPAIVIAHSMGGLVAHHAMNMRPDLFRGLVYVGTPHSCLNILGPLRYNDSVLLSKTVLTAEANFMMRSSFVFLPRDGRVFWDRNTQQPVVLDLFDVQTWEKYNLSPLVAADRDNRTSAADAYSISKKDALDYLKRTLSRTQQFHAELAYKQGTRYPPLAVVYGNKVPSVRGVFVDGPHDIAAGIYDDFFYGAGDGVIHEKWLMPENVPGFKTVAKIASDCGHVSLLTDLDAIGKALCAMGF